MDDMIFDILFNTKYEGLEDGKAELKKLKGIVDEINKELMK